MNVRNNKLRSLRQMWKSVKKIMGRDMTVTDLHSPLQGAKAKAMTVLWSALWIKSYWS